MQNRKENIYLFHMVLCRTCPIEKPQFGTFLKSDACDKISPYVESDLTKLNYFKQKYTQVK